MPVIKDPVLIERHAQMLYGCSNSKAIEINDGLPLRAKGSKALAYVTQRQAAKARKIEWKFDFSGWVDVWEKSGKWERRGVGVGFCMARNGDVGPYSKENVSIKTNSQNASEAHVNKPQATRNFATPKKTHCVRGHEINEQNRDKHGNCKPCASIIHKKYYLAKKARLSKLTNESSIFFAKFS